MFRVRQQIGYDELFFNRSNPRDYAVAIVDSGIIRHPDLEKQVIAFYDFSNEKKEKCVDYYGHGTHVAGCLAGNGSVSKGRYHGICPGAKLVILKVLNCFGVGEAGWLMEALNCILLNHQKWNIKVVNLSLGVEKEVSEKNLKRILFLVEELLKRNILIVCAAGNYGPKNNTIYGIGAMKEVITVGCYDGVFEEGNTTFCRLFSGRGDKNGIVTKPDIVAPGTRIISCSSKIKKIKNGQYSHAYEEKSGTSMATPIISGVILGILLNHPDMGPWEVKRNLFQAVSDTGYDITMQGRGFIDCKKLY